MGLGYPPPTRGPGGGGADPLTGGGPPLPPRTDGELGVKVVMDDVACGGECARVGGGVSVGGGALSGAMRADTGRREGGPPSGRAGGSL